MKTIPWIIAAAISSLLFSLFEPTQATAASQIGLFRPSSNQWFLDLSSNHTWDRCGPDGCMGQFGAPGDLPIAGDWSGSGVPKIGVFRPSDGRWYLDFNGNSFWDNCAMDSCFGAFGMNGDLPVSGNWTGTGPDCIGVFRPNNGYWYLDRNGNGLWDGCVTDACYGTFGMSGDLPVTGDINQDGATEIGVFRPSTGYWFLDENGNGLWDGCAIDSCLGTFGMSGDRPVLTDINGDGMVERGVFRASTGMWFFDLNHDGTWSGCGTDACYNSFGMSGDLPVVGAWDRNAGPGDPLDYFPLTQGSTWTYQGSYSDSDGFNFNYQNTATVSGTRVIDGVTTSVISVSNPGGDGPFEEYLLKDGRGITNWGNNDPADTITPLVAAYQEVIFPLQTGQSLKQFELAGVDLGEDLDGDWINERVNISSQVTVAGFENVYVPAGYFPNCAKLVNNISISGNLSSLPSLTFMGSTTATTWYAPTTTFGPGKGPVKIETNMLVTASNGGSFSYFDTESLTSANIVPSQAIGNPVQVGAGESPRLAVAANGDAVSVWVYQDSIWASRYQAGTGWEIPVLVENHTAPAHSPRIVTAPDGSATAVWSELTGSEHRIWANSYVSGDGWGTPELVDTSPGWSFYPSIEADAGGNITLLWKKNEEGSYNIWANRYEIGSGWGVPVRIEPAGGVAESPRLAVDAAGNATAVWFEQTIGILYDVWACRYVSGVGWGTPELIEWNIGAPLMDSLAIDISTKPNSSSTAVVVWAQSDGSFMSLWSNRYVPGVGWGVPALVESNPYDTFPSDVAIDADGSAMAVWLQSDLTLQRTWANRYQPGAGWGTPVIIQNNLGNSYADGKVIFDAYGGIVAAVWSQADGDQWSLWVNTYNPMYGWSTPGRLEVNSGQAYGPQIGIDASGFISVVWSQWSNDGWTIWANRF